MNTKTKNSFKSFLLTGIAPKDSRSKGHLDKVSSDALDEDTAVRDSFIYAAVLIWDTMTDLSDMIKKGLQDEIDIGRLRDAETALVFILGLDHGLAIDSKLECEYLDYMTKSVKSMLDSRDNGFQTDVYVPPNPYDLFGLDSTRLDRVGIDRLFTIGGYRSSKRNIEADRKEVDKINDGKHGFRKFVRDDVTGDPLPTPSDSVSVGIGKDETPVAVRTEASDGSPCELKTLSEVLGKGKERELRLAIGHRLGVNPIQAELIISACADANRLTEELLVNMASEFAKRHDCVSKVILDDDCIYVNLKGDKNYDKMSLKSAERKDYESMFDEFRTLCELLGCDCPQYLFTEGSVNCLASGVDERLSPLNRLADTVEMKYYRQSQYGWNKYVENLPNLRDRKAGKYPLLSDAPNAVEKKLSAPWARELAADIAYLKAQKQASRELQEKTGESLLDLDEVRARANDIVREKAEKSGDKYLFAVAEDERARKGGKHVKILVTSDIHATPMATIDAKDAELVIFAGDIMGGDDSTDDMSDAVGFEYLESEFFPWCESHGNLPIVVIPGNHDKFLYRMWEKGIEIEWPSNVKYLVDRGCRVCGLDVFGTPWCTKDRDGRFEASDAELAKYFANIPRGLDILVSHTPPYVNGEKIDFVNKIGWHEGSKELTEEIIAKKPRLCICGHIHEGCRKPISVGETIVLNVARVNGDRGREAVKPRIIRFGKETGVELD